MNWRYAAGRMGLSEEEGRIVYRRFRAFLVGLSHKALYKDLNEDQKWFLEWLFDNAG